MKNKLSTSVTVYTAQYHGLHRKTNKVKEHQNSTHVYTAAYQWSTHVNKCFREIPLCVTE